MDMVPQRLTPRRPWFRARRTVAIAWAAAAAHGPVRAATVELHFNRDIRPLLSENCFACHGPDPGSRKAGLRLDTREGFFAAREKHGAPVAPGKPEDSPLYRRLMATDPEELMPPPESHKQLKPEEKALVKTWIEQGAAWQPHWSFLKPERPAVPPSTGPESARNPIDAFVQHKLATKSLTMAPEADRRTLARRLALDLTGLPPKPADVDAFVADTRPDAYEQLVRKYLATPQWGEHRARYWLDAARYADTHGLHFDNYREMWPYRDWVIEAFNRNQPFDQFTIEQIAGDLLPEPTQDQRIATGFHRCNLTTNEGGTIEDENLASYARDRVETTSWVWLGLTANCAVCHDHKFDPIPTRDFYALSAFFRNTRQGGFDGNVKDSNPSLVVIKDPALKARFAALPEALEQAKRAVATERTNAQPAFERWAAQTVPETVSRSLMNNVSVHIPLAGGATDSSEALTAIVQGSEQKLRPRGDFRWTTPEKGKFGSGILWTGGARLELPTAGDYERKESFSYGGWIYLPAGFNQDASILGRLGTGDTRRGWDLGHELGGNFAAQFIHHWPDNALRVRTVQRLARKGQWQHVFVTYDGTGTPEGVGIYVDGRRAELEVAGAANLRDSIRTTIPFVIGQQPGGTSLTGGGAQDVRIYPRVLLPTEVRALAKEAEWRKTFFEPLAMWKKETREELSDYFLQNHVDSYKIPDRQLRTLEREREGFRLRFPVTHVQQEKTNSTPVARILYRGQYDQPRDEVRPAVFTALSPLPVNAPLNRLGLAQWLVAPENPLMARVTVNRFWQELFGTGLVKTSEDFGIMGETPVSQELLDWLAVEFRESGWDVKKLFTLIVTSNAYRQAATVTPEKLEKDPANRLLSRGPRFRMDAEMVRDYALAAAELLRPDIGGASVKPYQPEGVWEPVAMPESNTKNYRRDDGDALYRRSLYTFWKRAAPPAGMDVFNAPSRETSCLRRERTNTPLQALNTLNDIQFIEAARQLATLALRSGRDDVDRALAELASHILSRPFQPAELTIVRKTLGQLQSHFQSDPAAAQQLVQFGDSKPDPAIPAPQLAAYTMVANQLLNLDEVLNK